MDLYLKGKRALVTGGTKGIGRAIAFGLAAEGAHVAVCARDAKGVADTVAALKALGADSFGAELDVSDKRALEGFVSDAAAATSISAIPRAASRSATITANGLAGRFLRCRSRFRTPGSSARQARWKPPIPLMANTFPATSAATVSSMDPDSLGPHSGQAMVCAW